MMARATDPQERAGRLAEMVRRATQRGEYVPPGVALVGFRELTAREIEYGKTLEEMASMRLTEAEQ